jgi:hypothetical protein
MSTEAITQAIVNEFSAPVESSEAAVEAVEPQGDSDLAQRLAIVAKKEKSYYEKRKQDEVKNKSLEERYEKLKQWEELDKLATENPSEFFKKKGMSFEQIQQKMLESMQDDELDPIQKQLKELQAKLASKDDEYKKLMDDKFSERESAQKQQEIEEQSKFYNQELKKFISDKSDQYDLISTFEAGDEVFNVIKTVYLKTSEKGTPKLMTFDEACDLYEKKLEELVEGMKKSKKVSKIFGADIGEEDIFGKVSGQTTIDDSFSSSSAHSPELKTDAERLRAAAKLFEQQLKAN